MQHYMALLHKDEDSAYGISFPDLPGVFSAADGENDLAAQAIVALRLWAEDQPMPVPSPNAALIVRSDIRLELAAGAFLMRIPFIEDDTRIVRANVTFEKGMLDAIDTAAK